MLTAVAPRLGQVLGLSAHGFHRIALAEWGDSGNTEVAVCAHGLTRTGRDFDCLAEAMANEYLVLCPDVVGRGRSDWLPTADAYGYPQYNADMAAVVAYSRAARVDWIGTSMGGLIGMMLAAQPNTPIRRLVINDVGPFVPASALRRLSEYVGQDPHFADFAEGVAYMRKVHAPFGPLSEPQWAHLAEHALRTDPDGGYRLAYDPRIAAPFDEPDAIEDIDLWALWDAIRCPVLVLRGRDSDLLREDTAQEMADRGPGASVVEFEGVGHAPALMSHEQIAAVTGWLRRTEAA
ncbi:alpha/beta fold hydrolase [Ferruginivarius sediminum]|uniref:Alpha/beta hydrolase n=1 Tax=Ferruginivarius sediminum TaxID=2661937 RepID=A0A369T5S4_9PROT|nr:alpha/beta hydrolase [Ferruginivarius sediminum]RDD60628.1 alpha/beta hydrolase [Ferruginivarius sediminum]